MPKSGKTRILKVVEILFDLALLSCFILQSLLLGCLLIYGYLPLPAQWMNRTVSGQLPGGINLHAEDYALTFDGRILIQNIELTLDGIQKPVFFADQAEVEIGNLWGDVESNRIEELVLSEGKLMLPAVYSPDGRNSVILDKIALRLLPHKEHLRLDSFAALHEDIRFRGSASWLLQPKAEQEAVNIPELSDQFFKHLSTGLTYKSRLQGLARPTILFQINAGGEQPLNIQSRISSRAYDRPELRATNLTLDTSLSIEGQTLVRQSSILLEADKIEVPKYNVRASNLSAKIEQNDWEAIFQGQWPDMEVIAERVDYEAIRLDSPRINLRPQNFPEVAFDGFTSGLKGAVKFSGSVNAQTRVTHITAAGSLDLLPLAPEKIRDRLPPLTIHKAPYYNLQLSFSEGFALQEASLRARVDSFEIEGLNFEHIRFRGTYKEGIFSIPSLYLRRDWQWLDLGFSLDSSTREYFLKLYGFAKPYDYNPILPRWWGSIFNDFDFEQVESGLGDFVIYGNTGGKAADFFFGHARARNVGFQGVRISEGDLIVRGRGPYAEVHRLNARSGQGFARGNIRFASRLDDVKGPMSVRLDLDTMLPLSDAKKLFDENIGDILSDFETDALPRTILKGAIFNPAYPEFNGLSYIDLTANCPFPLKYKGLPLDYLGFDLYGRPEITYLRDIKLGYAGGEADAVADIITAGDTPAEARFQFALKDADQSLAIDMLTSMKNGEAYEAPAEEASLKDRIHFKLHARGPVEKPLEMSGNGSVQIENEELYAIQLFGPLSRLLQDTRLGFTSFALNQLQARFRMAEGIVSFHQLQINGPRTRIEAPGSLKLEDFSLAMRVSVYLFGNAGNPDSSIRKIGDFITKPIPNLLEFELTGTPDNQKWQSLYDPRKFIPKF